MRNEDKAQIYDDLIRESDRLQRINSRYKSEYAGNIPAHVQKIIEENNRKLNVLVKQLENLFV